MLEVGYNDAKTVYADLTTIHKAGNRVKMWSMLDLQVADATLPKPYLSMRMRNEFDCRGEQYRFLASSNHSKKMGAGDMVYQNNSAAGWNQVPPNSAVRTLWKVAREKW